MRISGYQSVSRRRSRATLNLRCRRPIQLVYESGEVLGSPRARLEWSLRKCGMFGHSTFKSSGGKPIHTMALKI